MDDRRFVNQVVVGVAVAVVAAAAQASGEVGLIGTSADPEVWKSTADEPGPGWNTDLGFDDFQWGVPVELVTWGGVTSEFAVPVWDHAPVSCSPASQFTWLRAKFTLDSIPDTAVLHAHADDDCEIYINGELVVNDHTCNANNIEVADVRAVLVVGTNLIAIEADDCFGGCHGIIAWIVAEGWSQAETLYVDDDGGAAGDGQSWATCCRCLQDALALAAASGRSVTEIHVAQGTYAPDQDEAGNVTPGDRTATFQLLNGVSLMGGYAGLGAGDPDERDIELYETVLSGDLLGDDGPDFENNGENSIHVVTGSDTDETAVLDGVTVTAGHADGDFPDPSSFGGGMYCNAGSPTVTNCTFRGNYTSWDGGGMYCQFSSPTVTDCTFSGNESRYGSGMYNDDFSTSTVIGCTFSGNSAYWRGGGMQTNNYSHPTVIDCTFIGNTATFGDGGGMLIDNNSNPTVTNCTFTGNSSAQGGGMRNDSSNPTVANCILWGNTPDEISNDSAFPVVTYSDVQGGWPGVGNIDADPIFVDPDNGDLRLLPGSPCIDAGDNAAVPVGIRRDLDGNPRMVVGSSLIYLGAAPTVDMGAYEYQFDPFDRFLPGVFGTSDGADIATLFGPCP
jgi:parallel beta-helix repeat protein